MSGDSTGGDDAARPAPSAAPAAPEEGGADSRSPEAPVGPGPGASQTPGAGAAGGADRAAPGAPAGGEGNAASPSPATAPARQPGRFGRAESASRRAVLLVGSGVLAFVVGGLVMSGLSVRLGERVGPLGDGLAAWLVQWVLVRTWLWAVLPLIGWAGGRFLDFAPRSFSLTAVLSGEAFGLLLATASDGLDWVLGSPADLAARAVTLAAGVGLAFWSVGRGLAAAADAQAVADVEAEKRKAEYAEFLARAEGKGRD